MKNRGIAERALLKALIVAFGLGAVAHAGLGYLPLVGPPPLRLLVVKNPPLAVMPIALFADTNLTATLASVEAEKFWATTVSPFSGQTNSTDDVLPIALGAANVLDDPSGVSMLAVSPPNFLNITPQMLATYFHPVTHGTNAAADVIVPAPVIFMPPSAKAEPSSHAEYIVK